MMKTSCGCGICVGVVLALAVCGGVWYYFYCRNNPDKAEEQIGHVEHGWENVKKGGDKTLDYVKDKLTEKKEDGK